MRHNERIQLLDCTLRDGGHLNAGRFGREAIANIIEKLVESKIDIAEIGFLWANTCDEDTARYFTIAEAKRFLPADKGNTKFSLMADFIDLKHLEPYDGTIDYIRLSFKRHRLQWALDAARILMEKGYKVFINPVNCNVYSDEQYIDVLKQVNALEPYGFSIVDTFGVMRLRDLTYRYSLVENNLDPQITVGLHLHENMGLAYSLAQHFIQMASPKRNIVIDGSLLGMGRVPGNLCIEQIMDHMNQEYGDDYELEPVFDAIDDYIMPIKKEIPWGYAIPYALSAKYRLHRTYAEYLMNKWKLCTSDIERILSRIDVKEAELFNEGYAEKLYREYMSITVDDTKAVNELQRELTGRQILLVAPGASINEAEEKLVSYIGQEDPVIIGIHCVPDFLSVNFVFYTNIKRYEILSTQKAGIREIISSNLLRYQRFDGKTLVFDYSALSDQNGEYCDDSVIMMLSLLKRMGIQKVKIAGFDGIVDGKGSFYIDRLARDNADRNYGRKVNDILSHHFKEMDIDFMTKSYYKNYKMKEE